MGKSSLGIFSSFNIHKYALTSAWISDPCSMYSWKGISKEELLWSADTSEDKGEALC